MECKTRSGRIVREVPIRKERRPRPSTLPNVTIRRSHTEVLAYPTSIVLPLQPLFLDLFRCLTGHQIGQRLEKQGRPVAPTTSFVLSERLTLSTLSIPRRGYVHNKYAGRHGGGNRQRAGAQRRYDQRLLRAAVGPWATSGNGDHPPRAWLGRMVS